LCVRVKMTKQNQLPPPPPGVVFEVAGERIGQARVRVLKPCTLCLMHHHSHDPEPDGEEFERYLTLQPGDEIVIIGPTAHHVASSASRQPATARTTTSGSRTGAGTRSGRTPPEHTRRKGDHRWENLARGLTGDGGA
jgi:hypothetical protein